MENGVLLLYGSRNLSPYKIDHSLGAKEMTKFALLGPFNWSTKTDAFGPSWLRR